CLTNDAESVIRLRHLTGGIEFGNDRDQGRLNNRNLRTRPDETIKIDDVGRAHTDAAITCRATDIPFFWRSVNINVTTKSVGISCFEPAQPDDTRHNRIASGRIDRNYFTGSPTIFENGSGRSAVPD